MMHISYGKDKMMKNYYDTRLITLIGTPLKQSFAADMQNHGYESAGVPFFYFYSEIDESGLKAAIDSVKALPSFAGCAVTKPNKMAVMQYLDDIDPLCEKIGSCNTAVKQPDGTLKGYNTDALGFYKAITEQIDICGRKIFMFGAGGVGRAIGCILADKGAGEIYITDVYEPAATSLVNDINEKIGQVAVFTQTGDMSRCPGCDIIINASGIGFGKTIGQTPLPKEYMRADKFYFDACYNPAETQFLMDAIECGARILNGLSMSLYQGTEQFTLWTGKEAPTEAMRNKLRDIVDNGK